jgi:hypothetical protein
MPLFSTKCRRRTDSETFHAFLTVQCILHPFAQVFKVIEETVNALLLHGNDYEETLLHVS